MPVPHHLVGNIDAAPVRYRTDPPFVPEGAGGAVLAELYPPGRQRTRSVFVATPACGANHVEQFDADVRAVKQLLTERAEDNGRPFSAVGVSTNWEVEKGIAYLLEGEWDGPRLDFGGWDEISVGRNWGNTLAVKYMQKLPDTCPELPMQLGVPQIFIIERPAKDWRQDGDFAHGDERLLLQLCGADRIAEWREAGAPIPAGKER